jgi:recombination protein U
MAKNVGKIFEDSIKQSIPDNMFLVRLNDSPQAFKKSNLTRFTPKNPFDYICFNTESRTLFCLELKSTSNKYMSFEDIDSNEEQNKMIHKHQILGLLNASCYKNVVAGFLFNFRLEDEELTYFMEINQFQKMCKSINKKSFNIMDAVLHGAQKINGFKKRTRWCWNLDEFFKSFDNNI